MNHLTLYGYVFRCPDCGSPGEPESRCQGHEGPLGGTPYEPERVPVRVPGVGEEPRYTLEQVREGLLSAEAKAAAAASWDDAHAQKLARFMQSVRPGEVAQPMENSDIAGTALEAALDHFTQQPAGVGAEEWPPGTVTCEHGGPIKDCEFGCSDGNQQPQGGGGQ